jgi:hypothetical protein
MTNEGPSGILWGRGHPLQHNLASFDLQPKPRDGVSRTVEFYVRFKLGQNGDRNPDKSQMKTIEGWDVRYLPIQSPLPVVL